MGINRMPNINKFEIASFNPIELEKMVDDLFLHGSLVNSPGLLDGKMGISICFFHLYRNTEYELFREYAYYLLDEVFKQITGLKNYSYRSGLCGITLGLRYLQNQKFIQMDNDFFSDFDLLLVNHNRIWHNGSFDFYDGIISFARYAVIKLEGKAPEYIIDEVLSIILKSYHTYNVVEKFDVWSFLVDLKWTEYYKLKVENMMMSIWRKWAELRKIGSCFPRLPSNLAGTLARGYLCNYYLDIDWFFEVCKKPVKNIPGEYSLLNGTAGDILARIAISNPNERAWLGLL